MATPASATKSTNVRPMARRLLSGAFRTWGRIAPDTASKAMVRLMGRTARGRPSKKATSILATGARFTVQGPTGTIVGWSFGSGPAVYLAHGWNGRATQMTDFVAGLVSGGYRAVLFDQPGHGESAGSHAHVGLFAAAMAPVRRLFGPAHAVVAHSLGAAGVAVAQRRGELDATRIVFIAPSARPIEYVRDFAREFTAGPAQESRFFEQLGREVGIGASELDVPSFALPVRTLVIHDEGDDDVPFETGEQLAQAWPNATLLKTTGLGHRRILRDAAVVRAAVDFIVLGAPGTLDR